MAILETGSLRKDTAGKLPAVTAVKKSWRSYWWLALRHPASCRSPCRSGARVGRVGGARVVLERLMVRDVVRGGFRHVWTRCCGRSPWWRSGWWPRLNPPMKLPQPTARRSAGRRCSCPRRNPCRCSSICRRPDPLSPIIVKPPWPSVIRRRVVSTMFVTAVGLAGDQVDRARRRRPVGVGIGVVAHGEVLGVVPQRGDGVAVIVAHHHPGGTESTDAAGGARPVNFGNRSALPLSSASCSAV